MKPWVKHSLAALRWTAIAALAFLFTNLLSHSAKFVFAIGFAAAAFLHFLGRFIRKRRLVSLALAFLTLGPIVVIGRNRMPAHWWPHVDSFTVLLALFLVITIIRVEQFEEQEEGVRRKLEEVSEFLNRPRK